MNKVMSQFIINYRIKKNLRVNIKGLILYKIGNQIR